MKISVKVKPGSKNEKVIKVDGTNFIVHVKELPIEGKANAAVIKLLGNYFGIPKSNIQILKGLRSRNKLIEIIGDINAYP